jgi:hypothetical protein
MIYTVGLVAKYEAALDAGRALKRGPHVRADGSRDSGGWVWQSDLIKKIWLKLII